MQKSKRENANNGISKRFSADDEDVLQNLLNT